jgi:hypothetical protein
MRLSSPRTCSTGPGGLPRSFLPTYYFRLDEVLPAALADPVEAETGLTVWAVAAAGLRADNAAWMQHRPPKPLEALTGMVSFSWLGPLTWFEEYCPAMLLMEGSAGPWLRRADAAGLYGGGAAVQQVDELRMVAAGNPRSWCPGRSYR